MANRLPWGCDYIKNVTYNGIDFMLCKRSMVLPLNARFLKEKMPLFVCNHIICAKSANYLFMAFRCVCVLMCLYMLQIEQSVHMCTLFSNINCNVLINSSIELFIK